MLLSREVIYVMILVRLGLVLPCYSRHFEREKESFESKNSRSILAIEKEEGRKEKEERRRKGQNLSFKLISKRFLVSFEVSDVYFRFFLRL